MLILKLFISVESIYVSSPFATCQLFGYLPWPTYRCFFMCDILPSWPISEQKCKSLQVSWSLFFTIFSIFEMVSLTMYEWHWQKMKYWLPKSFVIYPRDFTCGWWSAEIAMNSPNFLNFRHDGLYGESLPFWAVIARNIYSRLLFNESMIICCSISFITIYKPPIAFYL